MYLLPQSTPINTNRHSSSSLSKTTMPAEKAKHLLQLASAPRRVVVSRTPPAAAQFQHHFHHSTPQPATPLPIGVVGPPPSPPLPATPQSQHGDRIERRRKQAEMLRQAKELRSSQTQQAKQSPLKKRFWKDVNVKETPGSSVPASRLSLLSPTQSNSLHRNKVAIRSFSTPAPSAPPTKASSPSPLQNPTSPTPSH